MSAELQQSATNVLDLSVKGASTFTVSAGVLTAISWIPQIAGTLASIVGIYVTIKLYRKKMKLLGMQEEDIINHQNGGD